MSSIVRPIALTIAGSDPSGGAGLQADLKTFTALGVYGASVVTALTAQNTLGVTGVHKVPADFIRAQFLAVTSDLQVSAIKTGMLGDQETVRAVAGLLQAIRAPIVVDPVMVATSGDVLLAPDAVDALRRELIPLARVITPNLPEAAKLLDTTLAESEAEMCDQARALLRLGCQAVLVKGGHGQTGESVDALATGTDLHRFVKPRIATQNTHGTGCALAAALTSGLAQGLEIPAAVERAKEFVWRALSSGALQKIGAGNGPIDFVFAVQNPTRDN